MICPNRCCNSAPASSTKQWLVMALHSCTIMLTLHVPIVAILTTDTVGNGKFLPQLSGVVYNVCCTLHSLSLMPTCKMCCRNAESHLKAKSCTLIVQIFCSNGTSSKHCDTMHSHHARAPRALLCSLRSTYLQQCGTQIKVHMRGGGGGGGELDSSGLEDAVLIITT